MSMSLIGVSEGANEQDPLLGNGWWNREERMRVDSV